MDWALRPVAPADADFLLRVYAGTRAEELALTAWDEPTRQHFVRLQCQAQARHYQQHWPAAEHSVILAAQSGQWHDVGRLWLDRRIGAVHVLDIALLPAWRGQGIGRCCLRQLQAQARAAACDVTIYVESGNPARRLYDRLGFVPVGQPDGVHQFMAWRHVKTAIWEHCDEQA